MRVDSSRPERTQEVRANRRIRVPEVRLINAEGEQVGIVPTPEAQRLALEAGLDLVEVSPRAQPPVCRLMDLGKYKYLQKKRDKESRQHTPTNETCELKLGYKTADHDVQTRVRQAAEFLAQGYRVKFSLRLNGRERAHQNLAVKRLEEIATQLAGQARLDGRISTESRDITMFLVKK